MNIVKPVELLTLIRIVPTPLEAPAGRSRRRKEADLLEPAQPPPPHVGGWRKFLALATACFAAGPGLGPVTIMGAEESSSAPVTTNQAPHAGGMGGGGLASPHHLTNHPFSFKILGDNPWFGQVGKPVAWLGLATEEASEALVAQLQLDPGVGLAVSYVAPDGPAAKAGLKKNDVLVEFEDQELVHPAQLRKLVQVRKEGDAVRLGYYRAGRKESVSVTLSKAAGGFGGAGAGSDWGNATRRFEEYMNRFPGHAEMLHSNLQSLQHSLGNLHLDHEQVQREVRHSMEQARHAAAEALRHSTNEFKRFGPTARTLEDLARGWVGVDKDATVTVNSSGNAVRTMVKADDTGTYVIVANPRKRLTAHGQDGRLLFDGEIDTPEQQAAVPRNVWQKVEPMVDKMGAADETAPEPEPEPEPQSGLNPESGPDSPPHMRHE